MLEPRGVENGPRIEPGESGDLRYYRRAFNASWIWNLAHGPRRRMYEHFTALFKPAAGDRLLDLGATNLPEPLENILELYYPHKDRIVAAGVEDCSFLERQYPGLRFARIEADRPLPFSDDAFDIGFSNAVIEHVGTRAQQGFFLRELIRVSRRCFVTTPNVWFPVELHTRLPLLHWLPPRLFRAAIGALGFDFYAQEANLNLLSARELLALLPPDAGCEARLDYNYFGGLPSNLMLSVKKRAA